MARTTKKTAAVETTFVGPVAPTPAVAPANAPETSGVAYSVAKQAKARTTLQAGGKTGLGAGWRSVATAKRNTREIALDAIVALGETASEEAILKALGAIKDQLGSGTPRSYFRAFVASGYLVIAE